MNSKAFLLVTFIISTGFAWGQNGQIKRGPRRQVNLDTISESVLIPGRINIKFKAGFDGEIESLKNSGGKHFPSRMKALHDLLRSAGMINARQSFGRSLTTSSNKSKMLAWDFQRWFTIQLPGNANIKAITRKLQALSSIIEIAEPSYQRKLFDGSDPVVLWTPSDSAYNQQWNFNHTAQQGATAPVGIDADIDLPEAWDLETGNSGVIVAVFDGGVDTSHPDLRPNLWIGNNGEHFGFNWYTNTPLLQPNQHGTHVCGIIGAVNNNNIGISGIAGGNGTPGSGARIMSMQVFSGNGTYAGDEATADAFVFSADRGAAIAQCSWGGGEFSILLTEAIDYFIMNGGGSVLNGGLVVFSSGNSANEVESFPGNYPPVVCVAGTNYDDQKSWYSVYGSWVDICAPGGETNVGFGGRKGILSTVPLNTGVKYGWMQGTSMACPHVSGVAALCISKAIGKLSNEQLRNILLSTSDDIYPLNGEYTGKLGTGRVNAFHAVQSAALASGILVDIVQSFTVTQSCGMAVLNWTKNLAGNNVLIAASDTLLFGIPLSTLQAGDALPGGGTIIYKGAGTNFSESLQSNRRRYYRIWNFSGTNFSFHKTNSALYNTISGLITIENAANCLIDLSWPDNLSCDTDSVMLIASNYAIMGTPSGIISTGSVLNEGGKVIYKGKANSFSYFTDLDSTIYLQKWNFNALHVYTNSHIETNQVAVKPNAIETISLGADSDSELTVTWVSNNNESCFESDTYLLAYSMDENFGQPNLKYTAGAIIDGGGTVLYVGKNNSFNHTNLNGNTNYCYKVWKIQNDSVYSFGKSICATTPCFSNFITPAFNEKFEGDYLSEPVQCYWEMIDNSSTGNALAIVNNSTNPEVAPIQGNGMLRFNAYNIPSGNTVRLVSKPIKKVVGKELDLLFRWYQDSSNYVTGSYTEEGVMVTWSTDKTNWQNIAFVPRVPDKGLTGWSYKQFTLPDAATSKDSIYISFLFISRYGNNCYLDDLAIKYSSFKPSDGTLTIAACESTDSLTQWTNYYDSSGDRLLSIKKNNVEIGKAGQQDFIVSVGGTNNAVAIPSQNNYATNPGGWVTMTRFYTFKPLIEPTANLNIRFYYFSSDFNALSSKANLSLSPAPVNLQHTNLYAWKINSANQNYNTDPSQGHIDIPFSSGDNESGFSQYVPTTKADTTTWKYTNDGNNIHSMEYLVKSQASGGLGIGSTIGRGALQLITYTFTGSGSWSKTNNWISHNKPPAILPANGRVIINPSGNNECILDTNQLLPAGTELIIMPGKKFRITGDLLIRK
ncbi:MAG: S8 family serine peptidase [Bacteroidota bacterium]